MKKKLLIASSIVILLLAGGFFILNKATGYTVYRVDSANICTWKDGKVFGGTLVGGNDTTVKIKKSDEAAFLKNAEAHSDCVYPQ